MMVVLWIVGGIVALLILVEIACRILHQHRFGIPFHSRAVGEYPYSQFVEQVAPPLFYRFRKGFRSPMVTINRFRCRGREPAVNGRKRRIMVIGESNFFGAKLPKEKDLWSYRLERLLQFHGYTDWEVLNAGNPMYNTVQHRTLWEQELRDADPDILLVGLGVNDVTQAWMMGSRWEPGAPWPWTFIMALDRKSPWWNRLLSRFCFYFFLRRKAMTGRPGFVPQDETFKLEQCQKTIYENLRIITEDARRRGAKVGVVTPGLAVDPIVRPEDRRKLNAIQSNWEEHSKGNMPLVLDLMRSFEEELCPALGIPFFDMQAAFREYPRRFECFLDIAHWNARGMCLVGDFLFRELQRLGWFDTGRQP